MKTSIADLKTVGPTAMLVIVGQTFVLAVAVLVGSALLG